MVTASPILQPEDNNYLTSRILFNQFKDNSFDLSNLLSSAFGLNSDNPGPKLLLDGSSRAYLEGSVKVVAGSPVANTIIFELPQNITIPQNYIFPVAVLRSGAVVLNAVQLNYIGAGIQSVNVTNGGVYSTLAVPVLTGAGTGAVLTPSMGVNAITSVGAPGTGYVPNEIITATGGTHSVNAQFTVNTTKVVSATVASGGTGGTDGTQTVTGTTGTGTKFQASVTVAGGAITAVLSISVAGSYTVNPTAITNEPVTGAGLVGATLNIVMGVGSATPTLAGAYTALPSNPVAQGSASGSGVGATFNVNWKLVNITVSSPGNGYDSTSVISSFTGTGSGAAASLVLGNANTNVEAILVNQPTTNDIVYLDGINFFTNSYTI